MDTALLRTPKKTSTSIPLTTRDDRITDTAKTLLGATASAYEPILERYIGRKVVHRIADPHGMGEYCGIVRDYTEDLICVLDVPMDGDDPLMDVILPRTRGIISTRSRNPA